MACQELAPVRLRVMPSGLLRESARMTSREPVLPCMQIVPSPCSGSTEMAVLGMIALTRIRERAFEMIPTRLGTLLF